jgi:hypothetical protein
MVVATEEAKIEVPAVARKPVDERAQSELLDYMIDNYDRINNVKDFSKFCPDLGKTSGPNASYCSYNFNRNQAFLTNLSQRFTAVRGQPVPTSKMIQSLECLPPTQNEFRGIEDVLHSLDGKEDCDALVNVGDYKLYKKQPGPMGFTSGNYLLKKTGDNNYQATLNIDFKTAGGSSSPAQMLEKVRGCFAIANRSIKGPSGEKLSVRILSPEEAQSLPSSERPIADEVNIRPQGIAIDSGNFTGEAECPTLTHEILHHLGLCDEYKETRTDLFYGMTRARSEEWSCRVVPSKPSIMKNHVEGFNAAVPRKFTCECVNPTCEKMVQSTDPVSEAQKKILMTSYPNPIIGANAKYCLAQGLTSVKNVDNPDKAFVDVQYNNGLLRFQSRTLFSQSNEFYYGRSIYTCQCPAGDSGCADALKIAAEQLRKNPQTEDCPLHTRKVGEDGIPEEGETTSVTAKGFSVVTTPRLPSLLYPGLFDRIMTGACKTTPYSLYKTCSEYAYLPSDGPECSSKPQECNDDNKLLGVSAQ